MGSSFNFKNQGFENDVKTIYPDPYMGRDWSDSYDLINSEGKSYHPRHKGNIQWHPDQIANGLRGYNYWNFYYTLKVSSKNLVYKVTYDECYEDYSNTSSNEIRVTYGNDKIFQIYTGIVCVDTGKNIWVMKLVDLLDFDRSF